MKHSIRYYERIRGFVCLFLRPWLRHLFQLEEGSFPALPERFLLVGNHVSSLDPLLVMLLSRRFMFFVATEHLFSLGLVSRIIRAAGNPIPRQQGGNASGTVLEILRRLKNEGSVGIFAEGNCTWNGLTSSFLPATGKMARAGGVPLVTIQVQGYLASPRWGFTKRRGPYRISLQHIYQPETLKEMTPEEINECIARDIFEDAYARQEQDKALYPGKRLAEGLEFALLICPRCRSLDSLKSRGSQVFCSCGLRLSYDEWGYFNTAEPSGAAPPFTTVKDWDLWQKEYLSTLSIDELPPFRDEDMQLMAIEDHKRRRKDTGSLHMDTEAITLGQTRIPLKEIQSFAIRYKGIVSFSTRDGSYYEILKRKKKLLYHGRKYLLLYQRLKETES